MGENAVKKKVLLGLSGGVDSTAAALLLQKQGFSVQGLFFDVTGNCDETARRAERMASELDIPFYYKDASAVFKDAIISYFCRSYEKGETPNPCIFCNPGVKFKILKETADEMGAEFLATGHYARIRKKESGYYIYRGKNLKKDQSYMLYRLEQDILSRLIFPLGEIDSKEEIRAMLRKEELTNAEDKDSQEICFIGPGEHYIDYLKRYGVTSKEGDFVDREGRVMGRHSGLIHYTIGQRKGLGITFGRPVFVTGLDPDRNQVILGENKDLFTNRIKAVLPVYSGNANARIPDDAVVQAKIRYAAPASQAVFHYTEDGFSLDFQEAQRAATPGQSAVFYDGDRLLGGGVIAAGQR